MKISLVRAVALVCGVVCCVKAQTVIVSDSFSGTNGTTINGRTPDGVNLPGRTYSIAAVRAKVTDARQIITTAAGALSPSAQTAFNGSTTYNLSSAGGYTKPSQLTLSLDLQMNTLQDDLSIKLRGIGLGFYSTAPTAETSLGAGNGSESYLNFTGLRVSPSGALSLVVAGVQSGSAIAFSGTFSNATFYTLTYSFDTVTGSITNAVFNGVDYTGTFSGATTAGVFTDSLTNLFGFYGSSYISTADTGRVDNLSISTTSAIPEPAMFAVFAGLSSVGLALWRRRVRSARS